MLNNSNKQKSFEQQSRCPCSINLCHTWIVLKLSCFKIFLLFLISLHNFRMSCSYASFIVQSKYCQTSLSFHNPSRVDIILFLQFPMTIEILSVYKSTNLLIRNHQSCNSMDSATSCIRIVHDKVKMTFKRKTCGFQRCDKNCKNYKTRKIAKMQ